MLPDAAVDGVGAVADEVPPFDTVYHLRSEPVAVNGAAVAPWQYVTGVVTTGALGNAFTVTVTAFEVTVWLLALTVTV